MLFSNIKETSLTPVKCSIFIQAVDFMIRRQPGRKKKSVVATVPYLQREWFPFWSTEVTKRLLQKLRRIGVIKTQMVYKRVGKAPQRFTRIAIDERRILELAEQIQGEVELSAMAKRVNGKAN